MNQLPAEIFQSKDITIPDDTTQDKWLDLHGTLIRCKSFTSAWLKSSRKFAADKWGIDFVAESEVQMELALGIETKEPKQSINPDDKSRAIVTIEGISQKFELWQRKMDAEIETWETDKLKRLLALIEPMEAQARRIRERLSGV